jgi:DNA polymerase/3'-5' exonuclease PolX
MVTLSLHTIGVPGLGPKRLKLLIDRLGIRDRGDLEKAIKSDKLRKIRGFGPKIEERIRESLLRRDTGPSKRILYPEAARIGMQLSEHLRKCAAIRALEVAGCFRRRRETIGDLDVVAATTDSAAAVNHFIAFTRIAQVTGSGETKTTVCSRVVCKSICELCRRTASALRSPTSPAPSPTMCICGASRRSADYYSTSTVSFAMALSLPAEAKRTSPSEKKAEAA